MHIRPSLSSALVLSSVMAFGCGSGPAQQAEPAAPPAATVAAPAADAAHSEHTGGRVFFVSPKDGATVKSPVQLEFGSEMFTIAAVPQGEVTAVRAGTGHFHLGVDTDCLPAGSVIPKASPWVHFGDGKNVIETQLNAGAHRLVVQAGDDKHQTMTGLCEVINVTVTE